MTEMAVNQPQQYSAHQSGTREQQPAFTPGPFNVFTCFHLSRSSCRFVVCLLHGCLRLDGSGRLARAAFGVQAALQFCSPLRLTSSSPPHHHLAWVSRSINSHHQPLSTSEC